MTPATASSVTPATVGVRRRWWQTLTVVLAGAYLMIGLFSPTPSVRWPYLIAALLILGAVAAATRSRPLAWTALIIGALAPIATTWWSVVGPVTALLVLGCGTAAIRATSAHTVPDVTVPPATHVVGPPSSWLGRRRGSKS